MNQIDLNHRHAVVTGGAQGLGYSIASRLLASGASVSLWDRDAETLKLAPWVNCNRINSRLMTPFP
jgi:NAD(P)-dependent dehydrogenase (short-subunit alcohol dehydrogenase family)